MKILLIIILFLFSLNFAFAQMKVVYGIRNNGIELPNDSIVVFSSKESMRIINQTLRKERQYIDFRSGEVIQLLESSDNEYFGFRKKYDAKFHEIAHDYTEILGYPCMKTMINIRSNKIDVFYTDMAENFGKPLLYLAEIPGLVLKVIRNGSYEIYAKRIVISDEFDKIAAIPASIILELNESEFQKKLIESRYITHEIFRNEILNYNNELVNDFTQDVIKTAKGSVVLKKVKLPQISNNTIAIAEVTVRSNGDAYDRTGSLFAIPIKEKKNYIEAFENGAYVLPKFKNDFKGIVQTEDYEPPIELMRFISSFGSGFFGDEIKISGINWKDSIVYRLDISDLLKGLTNGLEMYIGIFIGNWDTGGHNVSLRIKYFEEIEYQNNIKWVMPIFNTVSYLEMEGQGYSDLFKTDTLVVNASIPEGLKNIKLKFLTTGHGNGEFVPTIHKILVDGREVFNLIPWRIDCASYREYNPASGNFPNGMSSSDYSRSNWCPGIVVTPFDIKLEELKPGKHEFKVIIPSGENSYWNVSGSLIGE